MVKGIGCGNTMDKTITAAFGAVINFVSMVINGLFLVRIRYKILSGRGLLLWQ